MKNERTCFHSCYLYRCINVLIAWQIHFSDRSKGFFFLLNANDEFKLLTQVLNFQFQLLFAMALAPLLLSTPYLPFYVIANFHQCAPFNSKGFARLNRDRTFFFLLERFTDDISIENQGYLSDWWKTSVDL